MRPQAEGVAGRQGFENGEMCFSKLVMARNFWSKRLSHRRLRRSVSFTAVQPSPRGSAAVVERFGEDRRCFDTIILAPRVRSTRLAQCSQVLSERFGRNSGARKKSPQECFRRTFD